MALSQFVLGQMSVRSISGQRAHTIRTGLKSDGLTVDWSLDFLVAIRLCHSFSVGDGQCRHNNEAMTAHVTLTAAVQTPTGRGAVAVVRVEGDLSRLDDVAVPLFRAANGRSISQQEIRRIAFGRWGRSDTEEVVICRLSDDVLEIHCHGGDAAVRRILNDLKQSGVSEVNWQLQRVSRGESFEAECLTALSRATTLRTADILLEQSNGLLREAYQSLVRNDLLDRSVAEKTAEETPFDPSVTSRLDSLLAWADFGLHLTRPWNVVLTGRPNVGKSSLINRLLGYERAIVFDQPGTTRDVVTGETAFDGWPVMLADTAGVRDTTEELEAAGIALARHRLSAADLRLLLIDLSEPPTDDDDRLLAEWPDALVVAHKCDQPDRWLDRLPPSALRVSSQSGEGVEQLQRRIVERLVPIEPAPGTAIPISERQIALLRQAHVATTTNNKPAYETAVNALLGG